MSFRRTRAHRGYEVLLVAVLVVFLTGFDAGCAEAARSGRQFYVAPSGSNGDPGTRSEPFRTITYAVQRLRPGDTLFVRGGTYEEQVRTPVIAPGRPTERITVTAYGKERPVIKGLLWLRAPDWWVIDGINVTWSSRNESDEHMVKLIDGVGWDLVNSEIWGARSSAALLVAGTVTGEPSRWRVADNCIHHTYETHGTNEDQLIYANTGLTAGAGTIERNLLFEAPNGMGVKLGGPDPDKGGAANVTVRFNTVYDTSQNVMVSWRSRDNTLVGNLLGRVGPNYSNLRGYQLTGADNVATGNAGFDAESFVLNDPGYRGVATSGNVFSVDPQFDSTTSCRGFHPRNDIASRFGRYAP